jgi:hypothetical protein
VGGFAPLARDFAHEFAVHRRETTGPARFRALSLTRIALARLLLLGHVPAHLRVVGCFVYAVVTFSFVCAVHDGFPSQGGLQASMIDTREKLV